MTKTQKMTRTALLVAMGIIIPFVMPKISIPPASYTIASHVPIFMAMFISPSVAVAVSLGTAIGFFFTLPVIIALRALSHLIFAFIGALYIQRVPDLIQRRKMLFIFNLTIALIHAVSESLIVALFFMGNPANVQVNYFTAVFLMIGVGGFVHSIVDFFIAQNLLKRLNTIKNGPVEEKTKRLKV